MAAPIIKRKDPRFQTSEHGEFCEIEENLLSVILQGLDNENLRGHVSHYSPIDPKYIPIQDLPALFVYADGAGGEAVTIGTLTGNARSIYEEYYVTVEYWLANTLDVEAHQLIRKVCDKVRKTLMENMDVNSIFSGNSELVEVDLRPKVREYKNGPCMLHGFVVKMIYRKLIRSVGTKRS